MLGDSTTSSVLGGGAAVPETINLHDGLISEVGGGAEENNTANSGEDENRGRSGGGDDGGRSFGGNRWPRQETVALLKIRLEMDVAFRDATVKGPLWEQVSRKLGELGYDRSAKKCKEKFENVYKYHKRTKVVRCGKSDSKSYKFFEQLQALENNPPLNFHSNNINNYMSKPPPPPMDPHLMNISFSQPNPTIQIQSPPPPPPAPSTLPLNNPSSLTAPAPPLETNVSSGAVGMGPYQSIEADLISNSTSDDVDSSTSSDSRSRERGKKRKWKEFFERLMREVIEKQEEMQKRFLEEIEKGEKERVEREEAWRIQEMEKINREREILAQQRSMTAAKDVAITSILQKLTKPPTTTNNNLSQPPPPPHPPISHQQQPIPTSNSIPVVQPSPPQPQPLEGPTMLELEVVPNITPQKLVSNNNNNNNNNDDDDEELLLLENGGESCCYSNNIRPNSRSSRWPKVEVEALINLRTNVGIKYEDHQNGPKGQLWEHISSAMNRLGYNRNAKRCKEKWENINKYFKKVKQNKLKTRHQDSKTCPYFHHLHALYNMNNNNTNNHNGLDTVLIGSSASIIPNQQQPLMVRPEQQWRPPQQGIAPPDSGNEQMESEPMDRDDKDDDEDGVNYEIVATKPPSVSVVE